MGWRDRELRTDDDTREEVYRGQCLAKGVDPDTGEPYTGPGVGGRIQKRINGVMVDWPFGRWRPLPAIIYKHEEAENNG